MDLSLLKELRLTGRQAAPEEILFLKSRFPSDFVPDWLTDLLSNFRIIGSTLTLSEADDLSEMGGDIFWLSPQQMVSEAYESEPGISALRENLFPVGACAIGTGDPYFLDLNEERDDPPLVRLIHDQIAGDEPSLKISPDAIEVVSQRLSDFFRKASVD